MSTVVIRIHQRRHLLTICRKPSYCRAICYANLNNVTVTDCYRPNLLTTLPGDSCTRILFCSNREEMVSRCI